MLLNDWRLQELDILAKDLREALIAEAEDSSYQFKVAKAANNMELFAQEVNPARRQMFTDLDRVSDVLKDAVHIVNGLDTEAIESFVRLARESEQ